MKNALVGAPVVLGGPAPVQQEEGYTDDDDDDKDKDKDKDTDTDTDKGTKPPVLGEDSSVGSEAPVGEVKSTTAGLNDPKGAKDITGMLKGGGAAESAAEGAAKGLSGGALSEAAKKLAGALGGIFQNGGKLRKKKPFVSPYIK
jgi:hypothetical protein